MHCIASCPFSPFLFNSWKFPSNYLAPSDSPRFRNAKQFFTRQRLLFTSFNGRLKKRRKKEKGKKKGIKMMWSKVEMLHWTVVCKAAFSREQILWGFLKGGGLSLLLLTLVTNYLWHEQSKLLRVCRVTSFHCIQRNLCSLRIKLRMISWCKWEHWHPSHW